MMSARIAYPGVTDVGAAAEIIVTAGEERTGVDFALQNIAAASLSGRVLQSSGQPAAGAQVALSPASRQVRTDVEGRFSFAGLQPQRYVITASGMGVGGPQFGRAIVAVDGGPAETTLILQTGGTVSGRVVADPSSGAAPMASGRVSVRLVPTGAVSTGGTGVRLSTPSGAVEDGAFHFDGVPPGPYRLDVSIASTTDESARWALRSATHSNRDVLETPFDIAVGGTVSDVVVTLTNRVTELTGTLMDQVGRAAPELFVTVFSVQSVHWHERSRRMVEPAHPDNAGRFVFTGLPPGDYYLAVVNELVEDWHAPEYLEQIIPGALRVAIRDGERVVQDIRLAR
jgi:hypothetical protein